jgi:hypothetical protein
MDLLLVAGDVGAYGLCQWVEREHERGGGVLQGRLLPLQQLQRQREIRDTVNDASGGLLPAAQPVWGGQLRSDESTLPGMNLTPYPLLKPGGGKPPHLLSRIYPERAK